MTGFGALDWPKKLALLGGFLVLGALLAVPAGFAAVIGLVVLAGFANLAITRPQLALLLALAGVIIIPQYLILRVPGLPALPVSLGPLGILVGVLCWSALLAAGPLERARGGIIRAYAIWGVALVIGIVLTGSKESVMLFIRTYLIPLLVMMLTLYYVRGAARVQRLLAGLLVAVCIAALFAGVEFALKRNELLEKIVVQGGDAGMQEQMSQFYLGAAAFDGQAIIYRCFSFFTNPLEYGTFMTMFYPFALVQALTHTRRGGRNWYRLATILCAGGILLSFSRGPILALIISTFGMAIFLPPLRKLLVYACALAVLASAAAWPVIGERIQSRLNEVENVTARFKLWEVGLYMFADNPILGVGLSRYAQHQADTMRHNQLEPFTEFGGAIDKVGTVDEHFIQLAAETGLLGIGTYSALLMVFFLAMLRVWRRHPNPQGRYCALALATGGFNYLFNGLTISSYVLFVITLMFILFLALGASLDDEISK